MHEYGSHVFKENQFITFIFFFSGRTFSFSQKQHLTLFRDLQEEET